ncbi:DUF418 domain-containing protein [Actinoplanes sp. LDG1-06]|uniref:DUF418 domain-containing protein n=1 Tax=Paractinoplanes ovalisporus TaxID=2810368 RepID=A0ABS2AQA6_9ACTN|nr:DUF418 domain-containing protein [Actinoplanes ovalisporus]MBM2622047.1 DUF418 domain-containing protein [Actinoplanes ovalisporus]
MDVKERTQRALAPDLARGLMLALIALANSAVYLTGRPYGVRQHIVEHGLVDRVVSVLTVTLVDARAYPMFAALFAYGIVQLLQRDGKQVVRRRSLWLVVFGFVHALLLFPGDILGLYGLVGLVLVGFSRVSDRRLLIGAGLWLVVVAAVQGAAYAMPSTGERTFFWSFEMTDPLQAMMWRPVEWVMTPFGVIGVGSAVLVGTWAGRRAILANPKAHRKLLSRTAWAGLSIAVAGGLPSGLAVGHFWEPGSLWGISALHAVTGIGGGLGYAALIGLLAAGMQHREGRITTAPAAGMQHRNGRVTTAPAAGMQHREGRVTTALAACGRRSLSCYLFQSVVFVVLLMPYGLGLGGKLGTGAVALVALGTWGVSVLLADRLGRAGLRGPAEVVLRNLTYKTGKMAV